MKIAHIHFKSRIAANRVRRGGQSAFTMIEIAIALGVIAFALVAIIGILPVGLNVQKETHQDTIISQDGPFFLEAIRNGGPALGNGTSTSLDFLTNYVESIVLVTTTAAGVNTLIYTNDLNSPLYLRNGQMILGLLSTPEFEPYPPPLAGVSHSVTARIRALTGAATEQNGSNVFTAFHYYMNVELVPFNSFSYDSTDTNPSDYNPTNNLAGYLTRLERNQEVPYLVNNLYELRLKFSWPIKPNGAAGQGRQPYRTLVSAHLLFTTNVLQNNAIMTNWFLQPDTYSTNLVL